MSEWRESADDEFQSELINLLQGVGKGGWLDEEDMTLDSRQRPLANNEV